MRRRPPQAGAAPRSAARAAHPRPGQRSRASEQLGGEQVEGRRAVGELLRAGSREVREVLLSAGREQSLPLGEIAELARSSGVRVRVVDPVELEARARSPMRPRASSPAPRRCARWRWTRCSKRRPLRFSWCSTG